MIRVLFANVFFAPDTFGGATIVVEQLAECFSQFDGWQAVACSVMSRPEAPEGAVVKQQGVGVTNYTINVPNRRTDQQRYTGDDILEAFEQVLDAASPDILNIHCAQELGALCLNAARKRNIPVVLSTHDFWWLCERQFMINKQGVFCGKEAIEPKHCVGCVDRMSATNARDQFLREQMHAANLITYPSDYARQIYVNSGLPASRSLTLKNGITMPSDSYWQKRNERKALSQTLSFGFIGGPGIIKGWPEIRRAVLAGGLDSANFYLVDGPEGIDWWSSEGVDELPGNWHIAPRYTPDTMDDFFAQIDVMLFPSRWKETFGLTVREALARGIYVITADAGGTAEDCRPNLDSTVLPFDFSASQLQQAMTTVVNEGVPSFDPPQLHTKMHQALELKTIFLQLLEEGNHKHAV